MKKGLIVFVIILSLILGSFIFSGCSRNPSASDKPEKGYTHAMLVMPDGTIVEGHLDRYTSGHATIRVTIDGVGYYTSASNVVIWTN